MALMRSQSRKTTYKAFKYTCIDVQLGTSAQCSVEGDIQEGQLPLLGERVSLLQLWSRMSRIFIKPEITSVDIGYL
jgi:hypothetical protein